MGLAAISKIGTVMTDPLAAMRSVGGATSNGVQSWGGGTGILKEAGKKSPFHKPDFQDMPAVADPTRIDVNQYAPPQNLGIDQLGNFSINAAPQAAFRGYQMDLAARLADQAAGRGPSLAAEQAHTTMNQGMAQQMAMAASARGGNGAAMQRQAMMNGSDMSAQVTQQAAMARLAEQMQSQQLLGNVSGAARQQDLALATDQAKLSQATGFKNADMQVQKAQLMQQYANMGLDARKANLLADLQVQQLIQNRTAAANGLIAQADTAQKQMAGGMIGGASNIGAAAVMA